MAKTIVYIDLDDTIVNFTEAFEREIKLNPSIKYPQSQYRFFANLEPLPGAIEAIRALRESETYTVYLLSAPSVRNPLSYAEKREWVQQHFNYYDFCKDLILSGVFGDN